MKASILLVLALLITVLGCKDQSVVPQISDEPTVTIISPKNNSNVFETVFVDIQTTNIQNIISVDVYIDNRLEGEFTSPPFKGEVPIYYYSLTDSTTHNLYVKVSTIEDTIYTSDVIYFTYYMFRIESFDAEHLSNNSVKLYWEDNISNFDGYLIEERKSGENYEQVAELSTNDHEYIIDNLNTAYDYSFRLIAFNDTVKSKPIELDVAYVIGNFNQTGQNSNFNYTLDMKFNHDSSFFYTAHGNNGVVAKWDPYTMNKIAEYDIYPDDPNAIAIIDNQNLIAIADDYRVSIYNLDNFSPLLTISQDDDCFKLLYNEFTNELYAYFYNFGLISFDGNANWTASDTFYISDVRDICLSTEYLIVTEGSSVRVFDLNTHEQIKSIYSINNAFRASTVNLQDNELLISEYYDILVYNLATFQLIDRFDEGNLYYTFWINYYNGHIVVADDNELLSYSRLKGFVTAHLQFGYEIRDLIIHRGTERLFASFSYGELKSYSIEYKWVPFTKENLTE